MSFLRWVKGQPKAVDFPSFNGLDCYLCCPGPSLNRLLESAPIHVRGGFVIAMNTACHVVRSDIWLCMDLPVCYDRAAWATPNIKVARYGYNSVQVAQKMLRDYPMTYFAKNRKGPVEDVFREDSEPLLWNRNTFMSALHLAAMTGTKRIHLVGADFGGDADYFDDRKLTDSERQNNRKLMAETVKLFPAFKKMAQTRGIELISCTPESPINKHIPHMHLDAALNQTVSRAPQSMFPVVHSSAAEHVKWQDPASLEADRGVMVGAIAEQEWILPTWLQQYATHNPRVPLAVADFGISQEAKAACVDAGAAMIDVTDVPCKGWYRKPFALLASPFRRTMWLDLDTTIQRDISPLFKHADAGCIGVSRDRFAVHEKRNLNPDVVIYDTGVVVVDYGDDIVTEWALATLLNVWEVRGDQEYLSLMLHNVPHSISEIPITEFSAFFRDDERRDTAIVHWCGERGKHILRRDFVETRARCTPKTPGPTFASRPLPIVTKFAGPYQTTSTRIEHFFENT